MHSNFNYVNDIVAKNEYIFQNKHNLIRINNNNNTHNTYMPNMQCLCSHCSTYIVTHTLIKIYRRVYTYSHIQIRTLCIHTNMHSLTYIQCYLQKDVHIYSHTYIHKHMTRLRMRGYTHMQTFTYKH